MESEKMTTRQWLGRARGINREIDMLENALQDARDAATKITQNYESDGAQSSKDPHKLDRLAEYADMIREKQEALFAVKMEIAEAIYTVGDPRKRKALFEYYINGKSMEQIAVEMNYSYRQVKRYHRNGVQEIEEEIKKLALNVPLQS